MKKEIELKEELARQELGKVKEAQLKRKCIKSIKYALMHHSMHYSSSHLPFLCLNHTGKNLLISRSQELANHTSTRWRS